jgi:hypothetical protein
MSKSNLTRRRPFWILLLLPAAAAAQQAAELFPQPMVVEHQLVERTGDGDVFYGEPVRDTYGGSWIVSERPDGSRLVVDLFRREITEIRPAEGSYSTIGFGRFAELRARIARHEVGGAAALAPKSVAQDEAAPAELELVELKGAEAWAALSLKSRTGPEALPAASQSAEVRRFEIRRKGSPEAAAAEVWVDPRLRFGAEAQAALAAFEEDALGTGRPASLDPVRLLAEVRRQTDGALPLLTVMPLLREDGTKVGESEDRVLSAEKLAAFPAELARVPEGLTRTSHPLESILAALEAEAEIDAALAGRPAH